MTLIIVPAYAAVLTLLFVGLSARVIASRIKLGVGLGFGSNTLLERRMRVHANFAEYTPLALILLSFVELEHWPEWLVHGLCAALLIGRLIHAVGMSREKELLFLRKGGTGLTFISLVVSATVLLYLPTVSLLQR